MNPGLTEEGGQTARSVVDALKTQPLVLVLLLINLVFIIWMAWAVHEGSTRKDKLVSDMVALLAACPAAILPKD